MARHWCRLASLFFLAWMLLETGSAFLPQDERSESETQNTNMSEANISLDNLNNNMQNSQDAADHTNKRRKRTIKSSPSRSWTLGIVPFVYIDKKNIDYYEETMGTFERSTCIRFVPWSKEGGVTTNTKLGLDHQNYLMFDKNDGCSSWTGNLRGHGQRVNAHCAGLHEVGHALGMLHEEDNPHPDRYWIARYNRNYRKTRARGAMIPATPYTVIATEYDMSSHMGPSWEADDTGIGPIVTFLFQDDKVGRSTYYMMREISGKHLCASTYCSDFNMTCENDGYLTLVEDKCGCRCLPGLDPSTGCRTIYKQDPQGLTFPGGLYAMPKPAAGCPSNEFKTGSRSFFTTGKNIHSSDYDLDGKVTSTQVEQTFCVSFARENENTWPRGRYCLYRKGGSCPKGFKAGAIEFDDQSNSKSTGTLPDGAFGEKTKLEYCCKNTVADSSEYEMFLPSRKPIVLMKYPEKKCQKIRGMHVSVQTITVKQNQAGGITNFTGYVPVFQEKLEPPIIEFCHYKPAKIDCGDVIELTADNPEVTISSPSGLELECFWLLKAPHGERVKLDFISHHVRKMSCQQENVVLKIGHRKPGYPPNRKCGAELKRTIVSVFNTLYMQFSTYGSGSASFKAKASLIQNANLCYKREDRGQSYVGKVNVTRLGKKCLPWTEVPNCPYSAIQVNTPYNTILEENYCRNPEQKTGIQPWCYTSAEFCYRDYCDVCQLQKPFDTRDDCTELRRAGKCPDHGCALTCKDEIPTDIPIDASTVKCGRPPDVSDGELIGQINDTYSVGDNVTYQCRTDKRKRRERLCLTSGNWSPLTYVCGVCPSGWILFDGDCFAKVADNQTFDEAERTCQQMGAEIVTTKSYKRNNFLSLTYYQLFWIGLRRDKEGGNWTWRDGQHDMTYHLLKGYGPSDLRLNGPGCAIMAKGSSWTRVYCDSKQKTVCSMPAGDGPPCVDFLPDCPRWFQENWKLCHEFPDLAIAQCRYTCGICNADATPNCSVESPGAHAWATKHPAQRGQVVKYGCWGSYVPTQGDTVRGCDAEGRLLGSSIVCSPGCPANWTYFKETLSCYKYFGLKSGLTFFEAKNTCRSLGGNVAMPKSKEQNDLLVKFSRGKNQWIGMTRVFNWTAAQKKFLWDDDQEIEYEKWRRPSNRLEPTYGIPDHCVYMQNVNNWEDRDCNGRLNFTCQVPLMKTNSSDKNDTRICPRGWLLDSGKCYGAYFWMNFYAAKAFCQLEDAQLPAPKNQEEFDNFRRIFKEHFWMDLQDLDKDGNWTWGDGTPLNWDLWHHGPERRRGKVCARAYGRGWDTIDCTTKNAKVLCVKPAADAR